MAQIITFENKSADTSGAGSPKKPRSTMLRALSGEIQSWDQSSELAYGFNSSTALGNTSHNLLKTIFPQPLGQINAQLISDKIWRGELIHTRANGEQIKVFSEWKIVDCSGALPLIQETNALFKPLKPETAQLKEAEFKNTFSKKKSFKLFLLLSVFFLVSILVFLLITWTLTHENTINPLL